MQRALPILLAVTLATVPALAQPAGGDMPVDVELLLAVDVSGSMDPHEHAVQREGYLQALRDPGFHAAVGAGMHGRIAIAYMEWAGPSAQVVVIPWRAIDGPASAGDFADALEASRIAPIRGTSISGALVFGTSLFEGSGFAGTRRVIDVSGDGANRGGPAMAATRDAVVAAGFTINGLPIMIRPTLAAVPLDVYYRDCVIGGPGAFMIPVAEAEELAAAIRRKLILEVAGLQPSRIVPAQAAEPVDCAVASIGQPMWGP
ncbi:MAG: DUF1194 domain-containing protein [Alphaproteobacteria bacterium]